MPDLRKIRQKAGLRLAEAAKKAGMSQTILRHLEDGSLRPTAHEMTLLAKIYSATTTAKPSRDASGQGKLFEGA